MDKYDWKLVYIILLITGVLLLIGSAISLFIDRYSMLYAIVLMAMTGSFMLGYSIRVLWHNDKKKDDK